MNSSIKHPIRQLPTEKQPQDASQFKSNITETYDALVVGSGAGGAVIAKELVEGGMKVAIVEEGAFHDLSNDLAISAVNRLYRDQGLTTTLGVPIVPIPSGKCFGGTTVINSGTCFRLPDSVLSHWRDDLGLKGFNSPDLDRNFSCVEKEIHVEPSKFSTMSRVNQIIHEALQQEGLAGSPLSRNIRNCEGCGHCCYGCPTYAKQSMDVSYLPKALKSGASAYTCARVVEIFIDKNQKNNRRVLGIVAQALDKNDQPTGITLRLLAEKIIIAAGTFQTPILLKKSRVASDNRHIGRHLTFHPATKVFAEFEEEIRAWEGTPQAYYFDGLHDEGILLEGTVVPPDIASITLPIGGLEHVAFMKRYAHMASFGFMITDSSEGRLVRFPFIGPYYYYSLKRADVRQFQKGIAFLARLFIQSGAKKVYPLIYSKKFKCLQTLEDVALFETSRLSPGDIESMGFHPLGTCRMAVNSGEGVCDENFQVYDVPGLYLCDGSVIPSPLGVNPQLTIMALATRLAEKILGKDLC